LLQYSGAASIKFREKDVLAAARRLDPVLVEIQRKLASKESSLTAEEIQCLKREATQREANLIGIYQQLAVHFADLHDTPGRMARKGVIRRVVKWADSRAYFYWRLRRRLAEFSLSREILAIDKANKFGNGHLKSRKDIIQLIKNWFLEEDGDEVTWEDDRYVVAWFENRKHLIGKKVALMQQESLSFRLKSLLLEASDCENGVKGLEDTIKAAFEMIPAVYRGDAVKAIMNVAESLTK